MESLRSLLSGCSSVGVQDARGMYGPILVIMSGKGPACVSLGWGSPPGVSTICECDTKPDGECEQDCEKDSTEHKAEVCVWSVVFPDLPGLCTVRRCASVLSV